MKKKPPEQRSVVEIVIPEETIAAIQAYADYVQPRITFDQALTHFVEVGMSVELLVRGDPGVVLETRSAAEVLAIKKGKA